jgi:hypothetical protein
VDPFGADKLDNRGWRSGLTTMVLKKVSSSAAGYRCGDGRPVHRPDWIAAGTLSTALSGCC